VDRRSGSDRRSNGAAVQVERRSPVLRRAGTERRTSVRRSLIERRMIPDRRNKGVPPEP
jgi:hypothetical protein